MSKKSILEQALLQIETLEEAVKANAQGILASTMKQELNDLLKESMEEEEEQTQDEQVTPEEEEDDMSDETSEDEDTDDEEDLDNEDPTKDVDDMDSEDDDMETDGDMDSEDDDMGTEDDTDMSSMDSMDDMGGEEDTLDMTGASSDEVLKVFKAMKPEDGIVVKKDGNKIELATGDDDFIIKLDEEDYSTSDFGTEEDDEDDYSTSGDEMSMDEEDMTDEDVYEIDLGDDDMETGSSVEGDQTESARTIGNGYHAGIKSKKKYYAGNKRDEINEEVTKLRKQNLELKKALVLFKEKLNEVAVFNAGLAYSTQLFTEHSTTKQEKLNIMKRFNSISTLTEGKNLYKQLTTELGTKKPVTETVVNKITLTPKSSSTEILSEAKAYENPQFKRMKDLMNKIK